MAASRFLLVRARLRGLRSRAMKDAPRPDPVAAALRVKEGVRDLARGALGAAGDLASDVAVGYR
jgi:hypothetical protein